MEICFILYFGFSFVCLVFCALSISLIHFFSLFLSQCDYFALSLKIKIWKSNLFDTFSLFQSIFAYRTCISTHTHNTSLIHFYTHITLENWYIFTLSPAKLMTHFRKSNRISQWVKISSSPMVTKTTFFLRENITIRAISLLRFFGQLLRSVICCVAFFLSKSALALIFDAFAACQPMSLANVII